MCNFIKRISIIVVLVFLSINIMAQPKIESLKYQLKISTNINNKIEICYQIDSLYFDISTDSSIKYANYGLSLIDDNHSMNKKNDFLYTLGIAFSIAHKHKAALKYYQLAADGYKKVNNRQRLINTIVNIGTVYGQTCNYDKALSNFQQSLLMSNELKDTLRICNSLTNIGLVYTALKEYKSALSNFEKVLDIATKLKDTYYIASSLNKISNLYTILQKYKLSLKYNLRALELLNKKKNKEFSAYVTTDIGETYKKLDNMNMALKYFGDAYLLSKGFEDKFLESHILFNIGDIYINKKNFDKAKEYLDNAEKIATVVENKETLKDIYESFSKYYSETKDYQNALVYYKQFKEITDSIYTKESSDKIAELQVKFDIQEKDNENEILRQKTEIQQLAIHKQIYLRNTFIYISIIITLLVIFIFYRYWLKHRANRTLTQKNEFINIQKNELQEAYNTKDRLFSIITHDLKNPFGSLVSLCGFLEENYYTLNDDHKFSAVQSLKRSIINVNELLINLTDWLNSKIDNLKLEKTDFNLNVIIESVLNIYSSQAEQKSIDLQMHLHKKFYVFGDERIIKTVLRNLIDNALKFTPVQGKIDINAIEDKDKIIVAVKDTGVGIDEADKDKLFNLGATFTTEGTHYEKGGGLGLILSKEFIEKNEGKIWFESEIGKGSTFYFTLIKGGFYEKD